MKYRKLIEALEIFDKYDPDGHDIAAEHDVIYAGPDPDLISDEDTLRLEELGWHNGHDGNGFQAFV